MVNYKVNPDDISTIQHYEIRGGASLNYGLNLIVFGIVMLCISFFWAIYNLIFGGYGWIICLGLFILIWFLFMNHSDTEEKEVKHTMAITQSEYLSEKLNLILTKSSEIRSYILPFLIKSIEKSIENAKIDLSENAISPFWDNIEESIKYLALYKDAVVQLQTNGELYSGILKNKSHNFPFPFPIESKISVPNNLLDDFNAIIRKAHTKPSFGNIWEQRKTQKIIITGFQNLGQAINNMRDEIVNSIENLERAIHSEFRELKNIQFEQVKNFENSQTSLNNLLSSMDTKLYFIEYHKKPNQPFLRPFSDI